MQSQHRNRPCWTYTKRWKTDYISSLLRNRHVVGEYQPGKCPRGCKRTDEGEPIENYYPAIIDEETWQKVQRIRASNFAHGKVSTGNHKGKGRSSWRNIFVGLLYDEKANTVIYKRVRNHWEYLISSDRRLFKTHKMRYDRFKTAILQLLNDIDWGSLIESSNPALQKELAAVESEIQKNELRLARYGKMLELDNDAPELLLNKIKVAEQEAKELQLQKEWILSRRAAINPLSDGIPAINVNQTVKQCNLELRQELRKRIQRIDITFNAKILTAGPGTDVEAGEGKIVAKLTFTNGTTRFAIIDKNRAVLLS